MSTRRPGALQYVVRAVYSRSRNRYWPAPASISNKGGAQAAIIVRPHTVFTMAVNGGVLNAMISSNFMPDSKIGTHKKSCAKALKICVDLNNATFLSDLHPVETSKPRL